VLDFLFAASLIAVSIGVAGAAGLVVYKLYRGQS